MRDFGWLLFWSFVTAICCVAIDMAEPPEFVKREHFTSSIDAPPQQTQVQVIVIDPVDGTRPPPPTVQRAEIAKRLDEARDILKRTN